MSWVAVAIGGSALVGGGASLLASNKQAKAAKEAAQLQQRSTDQSVQLQREAMDFQRGVNAQNQTNIAPYLDAGAGGLNKVNDVMAGAPGWDNFLRSPDYQFRFGEGMRGLENSAASRGGLLSGNFLRGATDYGQKAASQEFGSYFGRIMDVARLGQNSAVGAGSLANTTAGQIGQTAGQAGNTLMQGAGMVGNSINAGAAASASGPVGAANAANSGVQNYLFMNALQNRPGSVYSGSTPMASYLGYGNSTGQFNPNVPGGFQGYA